MDLIKVRPYKTALQHYVDMTKATDDSEIYSKNLSNILKIGLFAINATAGGINFHNAQTFETTIVAEANTSRATDQETISDLGEVYDEREYEFAYNWIAKNPRESLILQREELPKDSEEYSEFLDYGFFTALYVPIRVNKQFWGYIEVWESRYPRPFKEEEIELMQGIAHYVSLAVKTIDFAKPTVVQD